MNSTSASRGATDNIELTVLLIDKTGSMAKGDFYPTRLGAAQEAALAFVRRKRILDGRDRTAVAAFCADASTVSAFGRHPFEVQGDIARLRTGGSTNITAGLELALSLLQKEWTHLPRAVRRCILLSDGEHNEGADPITAGTVKRLLQGEVVVDCIAIGNGEELLRRIARETSGEFVRCSDFAQLLRRYEQMATKKTRRSGATA